MENKEIKLELRNISKHFKGVYANKNVNIDLKKGEILSILGENGSGKTTLMNVLSGIYTPDEGEIYINGRLAHIHSPKDAFEYGIGMVHQHFKLVDTFTAIENIIFSLTIVRVFFAIRMLSGKSAKLTKEELFDRTLYTAACKAATKAGYVDSEESYVWLINKLFEYENVFCCPHGRPIIVKYTKNQIEKMFNRT